MRKRHTILTASVAGLMGGIMISSGAFADETSTDTFQTDLERLKTVLEAQESRIEEQSRQLDQLLQLRRDEEDAMSSQRVTLEAQQFELEKQRAQIEQQRREIEQLQSSASEGGEAAGIQAVVLRPNIDEPRTDDLLLAQDNGSSEQKKGEFVPRPEIQALPEQGGVLTPPGQLQLEPALLYTQSNLNRFTFRGIEIVEAFLIGVIEAQDADRDTITGQLTGRYGFANRIEVEATVPVVYRDDSFDQNITLGGMAPTTQRTNIDGFGLGDVEVGAHYQVNSGRGGWPFLVGNLRVKTITGEGPFDVERDADGVQTELATGSGFFSFSPSVTAIYPTDPAVFFANVGYTWAVEDTDINERVGGTVVRSVDPGDSIDISFGVALALNPRASLTLGYSHQFVEATQQEIDLGNGAIVNVATQALDVGTLLVSGSLAIGDATRLNVNVKPGITADAPDVTMEVRIPTSFDLGVL